MTPTTIALVYVGVHDAVDNVDVGYTRRDEPIDVPYDVAMRLLEQRANWAKAPESKLETKGGK